MKIIGIISEYNPLHAGHQWQMAEIRRRLGSDCLIINVLSGHFVQRGEPACLDKFKRAQLAVQAGADLVIELPFHFSCAAAGYFAKAAVQLLQNLGLHMHLCFGSEINDRNLLHTLSAILQEETAIFKKKLQEQLNAGQSFAAARSTALADLFLQQQNGETADDHATGEHTVKKKDGPNYTEAEIKKILRRPNVILALEYMAEIKRWQAKGKKANFLTPFLLPRLGQDDHETDFIELTAETDFQTEKQWLSASAIRQICTSTTSPARAIDKLAGQIPDFVLGEIAQALRRDEYFRCDDLFSQLLTLIHSLPLSALKEIDGLGDGLAERLKLTLRKHGSKLKSWSDLLQFTATKHFPKTRIQRAFCAILLQMNTKETGEIRSVGPQYIRPLAASKNGKYLLRKLRKTATLPLINRASDFLEHKQNRALYMQGITELKAGDCLQIAHHRGVGTEFKHILSFVSRPKHTETKDEFYFRTSTRTSSAALPMPK